MYGDALPPGLRASDADREATAERLKFAAVEGRLDHVELDERLAAAYSARTCGELTRLTADVTPPPAVPVAPARPVFVRRSSSPNLLAIASIVAGVMWFGWIGSLLAIVLGHLALRQIAGSGGAQGGRGVAIAGLVLGYVGAAMLLLVLGLVPVG